jgi:hypothetical protein
VPNQILTDNSAFRASPGTNRSIVLASAASSRCSGVTEQSEPPHASLQKD